MIKQRSVRIMMIPNQKDDDPKGCSRATSVLPGLPRTIRRHELRLIVPLADTTIYEMEKRGEFPRRFNLTAHHSRIERRRFKRSQLGFRPDYGKRRRRPAARQSRDMDSPARSGAYGFPSVRTVWRRRMKGDSALVWLDDRVH
jgi:hypothetical protein